jgi:LysR family transcriptional regulator, regulator for bpeEF and oprC
MDISLARIFVKVVQNGSFTRAATLLKTPKSTVSKAISRLERETGTRLLIRTTRSLTLTAAGRAFYDTCLGPIQILEDAQKSLYGQDSVLAGLIRITAPEDLGTHVLSKAIGDLTKKHPALSFELNYTDEVLDLVKDGIDLAVRIGKLAESSFKAKKTGEVVLVMVAAPAYLKLHDKIRTPEDVEKQDCLTFNSGPLSQRWKLRSKKEHVTIQIKARFLSNQMTSVLKAALSGAGVAFVPLYLCRSDIEAGRLIRVCPEWSAPGLQVSVVTPAAMSSSARLRVVGDELVSVIQKALET